MAAAAICTTVALAGCSVRVDKSGDGEDKNVSVQTPFGGVHVKNTNGVDTGLPVYPGATLAHDSGSKDKSVDLALGFGQWQLKVLVANYVSSDPPEKVQAFYRKALSQYGDVIACKGKEPVGAPTTTRQGLSCRDKDESSHAHVSSDSDFQLKAGSEHKQHIVGFEHPGEAGTRFALISLTLPTDDKGQKESAEE